MDFTILHAGASSASTNAKIVPAPVVSSVTDWAYVEYDVNIKADEPTDTTLQVTLVSDPSGLILIPDNPVFGIYANTRMSTVSSFPISNTTPTDGGTLTLVGNPNTTFQLQWGVEVRGSPPAQPFSSVAIVASKPGWYEIQMTATLLQNATTPALTTGPTTIGRANCQLLPLFDGGGSNGFSLEMPEFCTWFNTSAGTDVFGRPLMDNRTNPLRAVWTGVLAAVGVAPTGVWLFPDVTFSAVPAWAKAHIEIMMTYIEMDVNMTTLVSGVFG